MNKDSFKVKILRLPHFMYIKNLQRMKCEYFPPLALGVLVSYLRAQGIEIEQDDLNVKVHYDNLKSCSKIDGNVFFDKDRIFAYIKGEQDNYLDKIVKEIVNKTSLEDFNLILMSIPSPIDITPLTASLAIAKYIKENTNSIIILGGGGCSQELELGLRLGIFDGVVGGPGEIPLLQLVPALKNKLDISTTAGLNFIRDENLFSNSNAPYVLVNNPDFDGLPVEKYKWEPESYLENLIPNSQKTHKKILILPFRFIIGCPFKCAFCGESGKSKEILYIEPAKAVESLEKLSRKYNTEYFLFLHSTLNLSKKYINEFCEEIINRKLKFYWSDCANFNNLDEEILFKMREAGAVNLIWGLETGSSRLLKYINKKTTLEKARQVLKDSHKAGIWNGLEIICGLPHENETDIQETINFLNENKSYIDTVYFNPFYLDSSSLLFKSQQPHGITNIKEINKYASHTNHLIGGYAFQYAFDEIGGLKWEDKLKQIAYSCDKVMHSTKEDFWTYETVAILFYLYSIFEDKKEIKNVYDKWAKWKIKQLV